MKYKVGDKVKIKSLEWYKNSPKNSFGGVDCGSFRFSREMSNLCGNEATICNVFSSSYGLNIEKQFYYWTDEMFEDETIIEEPKELKVIDWEQRRYEIAKDVIAKMSASCASLGYDNIIIEAIYIADKLIEKLKEDTPMTLEELNSIPFVLQSHISMGKVHESVYINRKYGISFCAKTNIYDIFSFSRTYYHYKNKGMVYKSTSKFLDAIKDLKL